MLLAEVLSQSGAAAHGKADGAVRYRYLGMGGEQGWAGIKGGLQNTPSSKSLNSFLLVIGGISVLPSVGMP